MVYMHYDFVMCCYLYRKGVVHHYYTGTLYNRVTTHIAVQFGLSSELSVVIVVAITVTITDWLGSTQHHRIGLSSVHDKVLTSVALEHDSPVLVCTNTAVWPMIRLWLDPYSIALRPDPPVWVYTNTAVLTYNLSVIRSLFPSNWNTTCLYEANITVASAYGPPSHRAWSPSRCITIHLWWSFSRCRVTKRFGGDMILIPAASYV
jgi:hypothetical protein